MVFFIGLSSFALAEERGGGSGSGFSGGGSGFSGGGRSSFVSPRLRSLGVRSVPRSFTSRSQLFSAGSGHNLGLPSQGPSGESFRASVVSPRAMNSSMVRNNMSRVNTLGFRSQIRTFNARETMVGHYYWHNYNGLNFCHYYDRWGCNWYGWYFGSSFYWSCWWGNYWWWYDPAYYRWCYWYDGWWWWQNPDNVQEIDVYNNGEYVPSNSGETQAPDTQSSTANLSAQGQESTGNAPAQIQSFNSKDGTRTVKLAGSDAFLYDTTGKPAFKAKYLASEVTDVRFSNTDNGKPLQIMLGLADGSFELYDADGNAVGSN
jgi:hypothetical protein